MPHSNVKPSTSKNVSNSRTRRNTREREKRKSQSSGEKNDNSTTEKTSPSKVSYKCTGLCKDLIQTWSTPSQFGYLKDVLCSGVAEDLSYRLRLVIHDSLTKARLCGRNSILASDIDDCLQVLQVDKIYGAAKAPQFAKDEMVINLFHLAEYNVSYPQPADVLLTRSWLPMTSTAITPADSDSANAGQTVVSAALSHYHRVVCRALVTPSSPRHRHLALHDLRTSVHIGPIVDWLYSFAYRVLRKDVSYGGPTTTQAALDLIEALEANVQAVSQVSNKVIELLVRLLLQRILRTCADNSLLRPMCSALALLCSERNCMRELVIGKLMTRAAGCAGSNANGSDDGVISIVIAAQVLGIEAVERVILPDAILMGLLCRVAKRSDNELTTALKLTYYTICKEYVGDNRLEIDDLFLDTFNYALLPMWVQPPYKQDGIVRDYNPHWVYSQLVKSRRILNYKILKIKTEDSKKMTLQQIFPFYHMCCNCRKVKTTNFFTPKNAPAFNFNKTATKCVKCVVNAKARESGLKPKLIIVEFVRMGQGKSQFTEEELQDYQDLTYFTKKEVLHAHLKFKQLAPEKVGHNKNAKLPMNKLLQYPELRVNPFGDRMCKVFSSSHDGDCTFEDFLDMMSVFSEAAPKSVKAEHAFRIFDFDGDDMLGVTDLQHVIGRLIGEHTFTDGEMAQLIQNVLEEADLDDDGALSFAEFEHIIDKSSDFSDAFRIRL